MKKVILALSFLAVLSTSFVSCSTDDSGLENVNAEEMIDNNGAVNLPKANPKP